MPSSQYIEFTDNVKEHEMLNWEKDRRNHMATEVDYDYLPAIGSFADQRRWARENQCNSLYKIKADKGHIATKGPTHHCDQLASYLKCVESAYFWKKSPKDQGEIVEIIKKLINRIKPESSLMNSHNQSLLRKAEITLIRLAN